MQNCLLKIHVCIENKYFTPKTAFYKALSTDYLDITGPSSGFEKWYGH